MTVGMLVMLAGLTAAALSSGSGLASAAALGLTLDDLDANKSTVTSCNLTGTAVRDASVDENDPTSNFGSDTFLTVKTSSGNVIRTFAVVNLVGCFIPVTADVVSARLALRMFGAPSSSRTYGAYRATAAWSEGTVNWNNQPATISTASDTTTIGTTSDVWVFFDVTADVESFHTGEEANRGWMIRDQTELTILSFTAEFRSSEYSSNGHRPRLTIRWVP